MTEHATGTFDVTFEGEPPYDTTDGVTLARIRVDKQFHGDLVGNGVVHMLSATGTDESSGGYVAIERVTGTLLGKAGSFVLQHSGTMNRGEQTLVITVVPDTGRDELAGIAGSMGIEIVEGQHRYAFDYTLP